MDAEGFTVPMQVRKEAFPERDGSDDRTTTDHSEYTDGESGFDVAHLEHGAADHEESDVEA